MSKHTIEMVESRIKYCMERLESEFGIEKIDVFPLFKKINAYNLEYTIEQYYIKGIGNMLIMYDKHEGPMQMATITITPYYKNLPLYTTDTIYREDKRTLLNEIYNLVDYQDELYLSYIEKFRKNMDICKDMPELPVPECWYEDIRPTHVAKAGTEADDEKIMKLCNDNLEVFIEMAKESPALDEEQKFKKWECVSEYARKLVENGGVSTDVFKKDFGDEMTLKFFREVFFAPDCFRNKAI